MSEVWNNVYTFFGEEPSNFALLCFNHMKVNSIKKVLELGAGYGRDSIFFASNGLEVEALDYSAFAVELMNKTIKEKRLPLNPHLFDVKHQLTYPDGYFDAAYSHMLFNMHFSLEELHFIFSEIKRIVKPRGFNFFLLETKMTTHIVQASKLRKEFMILMAFKSDS